MTPRRQRPFSAGPGGFIAVLVFGACFLTAGLVTATGAAAVSGTGWACAHADVARHDNANARAKVLIIKNSGDEGDCAEYTADCCGNLKLERV